MDAVWDMLSYGFIEWRLTPLDFQLKTERILWKRILF